MVASILAVAVTLTKPDSLRQAFILMENLQELGVGWFSPVIDSNTFYVSSILFIGVGLTFLAQTIVKIWRNPSILSNHNYQYRTHMVKIYLIIYRSHIGSVILGVPIRYWFTAKEENGKEIRTENQRARVRSGRSRYIPTNTTLQPELEEYEKCTDWRIHIAVNCPTYALEISFDDKPIQVHGIDHYRKSWGYDSLQYNLPLSYYIVYLSHPSEYYNGVKITPHYRCL